jgi:hypothetical protein
MSVLKTQPVHLAGSVFDRPRHVCALFHSQDEAADILVPFIREGFEQGDKSFHIVDARKRSAHERLLEAAGVMFPPVQRRSNGARRGTRLEIQTWEETYLLNGYFDQHRQLALIETVLTNGKEQGYPLTRLVANMEWALEPRPGVEDLVEYETRLNYVLPKYDDAVV